MILYKVLLAVFALEIFGLASLYAASSNPQEDLSQDPGENTWVHQMSRTYITQQVSERFRSKILEILRKTPEDYQKGVEAMAKEHIRPYGMDGYDRFRVFEVLCALGSSQPWVRKMTNVYIPYPHVMPENQQFQILETLSQTPIDRQEWVEAMAKAYITDRIGDVLTHTYGVIYYSHLIIWQLRETTLDQQAWVADMAKTYITKEMDGRQRWLIIESLRKTPVENQKWVADRAQTYISDEMNGYDRTSIFNELNKGRPDQ